jgi:PTS system nitrogen regulatory IIA component
MPPMACRLIWCSACSLPRQAGAAHLHALAAISRMMRDEALHAALGEAPGAEALYALLSNGIDRDAA